MNVTELIKIIEKDTGFSQSQVKAFLDSLKANIISTLKDNKLDDAKVTLNNFGTFKKAQRKKRQGRNIHTGKDLIIPARKYVKFIPSNNVKEIIKKT